MPVTVRIPTPMRKFTSGQGKLQAEAGSLREVLAALGAAHAGLQGRLFDDAGELRSDARIFVGENDIRALSGLDTPVPDGETVAIVPPVAGA